MGRPANGVPYLKGGIYHIRFKGDKEATSLDTRNGREAKQKADLVARKRAKTAELKPESVTPKVTGSAPVFAPSAVTQHVPAQTTDPLADWAVSDSEFGEDDTSDRTHPDSGSFVVTPPKASGDTATEIGNGPSKGFSSLSVTPDSISAPSKGLTADETSRMHGLLSGIVGRANVLALGLTVRIFGRVPAEPEPKDMELLNKAWQLQLDVLLEGKQIEPWMLILGASVGLGVGMYAGGEPIPKKVKGETPKDKP